ncbi:HAD-IA family hydrolase [Paenibacillus sp. FSL R5-0623]|uniref:HAD family hydrolase n=1 Tax=Paenibacillus TaxID=44249 RepID=UPI001C8DFCD9|nr:HAD-IA family hydrolase [Paenibacillus xylanexedens]MBY0119180.1 HAD-IA family hydrolase [Paenibacillus xylanexedens]MCF7752824.1 HAD-IA family hydrolase [Paenibacillus xylanexedens]
MIKALVFDFDGTIIDTETAWYIAFRDAYKEHGVDLTLEMYSQCIGTSLKTFNPYEYLITDLNLPIDREAFRESVQLQHAALMNKEVVRPGIQSYLDEARKAGLKLAVASSSKREWVEQHLEQLKLKDYFEVIRTADDVANVKPDPELYNQALEALGVTADEAVAIEDSPNGARAAAAAGMHCVVISNTITGTLEFDMPHQRLSCLTDLTFNDLISKPLVTTV